MQYTVSEVSVKTAEENIFRALKKLLGGKFPVFLCVGTDAVAGDSLGPLAGTFLEESLSGKTYVFGTLERPITALDVDKTVEFINNVYKDGVIVAIDAALGATDEIGDIKIADRPLKPGLGVKKDLKAAGDVSIIGVVDEREGKGNLGLVRFSLVYRLAKAISLGAKRYFDDADFSAKSEDFSADRRRLI